LTEERPHVLSLRGGLDSRLLKRLVAGREL